MFEVLSIETLIAFVTASVVLSLVPGPDNLFVMSHSALKGWRIGFLHHAWSMHRFDRAYSACCDRR